jgi:hypothetical protein
MWCATWRYSAAARWYARVSCRADASRLFAACASMITTATTIATTPTATTVTTPFIVIHAMPKGERGALERRETFRRVEADSARRKQDCEQNQSRPTRRGDRVSSLDPQTAQRERITLMRRSMASSNPRLNRRAASPDPPSVEAITRPDRERPHPPVVTLNVRAAGDQEGARRAGQRQPAHLRAISAF